MKTILCYGDSNTWGYVPGSMNLEKMEVARYPFDVRWTGRLQKILGNDYLIIEEGLCGRTTNIEAFPNVSGEIRSGKTYLPPCLFSHAPLDLVIIMLGVNDLQPAYNRSAQEAALGIAELIQIIQSTSYGVTMQLPPKILLIGYPLVDNRDDLFFGIFNGAFPKSKQFPSLCSEIAKRYGCEYLDMSPHIQMSAIDGLHFDEKAHEKFANLLAEKILLMQSLKYI